VQNAERIFVDDQMDDRLNYDTQEKRKRQVYKRVDTVVEDLSTTAVVPALEANMAAFWEGYGRAPGAELYEGEDLLRVVTGASEPLFNGVFRARLIPDAVEGAITETLAR
jgi:hypothetical protein